MEKKYSQREDTHLTVLIEQNSFFVQFFALCTFFVSSVLLQKSGDKLIWWLLLPYFIIVLSFLFSLTFVCLSANSNK